MTQSAKNHARNLLYGIFRKSIEHAVREQGLKELVAELSQLVPDITEQYSMFRIDSPYLNTKVRAQHAFQISLANKIIHLFENRNILNTMGDNACMKIKKNHNLKDYLENITASTEIFIYENK